MMIHTHTLTFSISTQDGVSALDFAKQQNHPQVCEILEKHGAKQTGPGSQVVMCVCLARCVCHWWAVLYALCKED